MRSGAVDAAHADHRRAVDLIGLPSLGGYAGLVHDAKRAKRLFKLGHVDALGLHEIENILRRIIKVVGAFLVDHAFKEGHRDFVQEAHCFKRIIGLREGQKLCLPGDGANADGNIGRRCL